MSTRNLTNLLKAKFLGHEAPLLAALVFIVGLFSLCLTPPFQVADEHAHFYRAFQISEGVLGGVKIGNETGGMIPTSVFHDVIQFNDLIFHWDRQISFHTWLEKWNASQPLDPAHLEKLQFTEFANSVNYSPVVYIPQVLGIGLAKFFALNTFFALYLARFLNLLLASLLAGVALNTLSFSLRSVLSLFLVIGMPMTVFQMASASADSLTQATSFVIAALLFRAFYVFQQNKKFENKSFYLFLIFSFVLSLCKSTYLLLPLTILPLLFRLPMKKRILTSCATLSVALVPCLVWSAWIQRIYSPTRRDVHIDPHEQAHFLLHHPLGVLKAFIVGLVVKSPYYLKMFVGCFGWLDSSLPKFLIALYLLLLLIVPWFGAAGEISYDMKTFKWGVLFICLGTGLLICITMYLTWVPVGALQLEGIQGRYFIPLAALSILAIPRKISLPQRSWRNLNLAVFLLWIFVSVRFLLVLKTRYWV